MNNNIIDRSTTYRVGKYRINITETQAYKDYTIFDEDDNLLLDISSKHAEGIADALLEVIYDLEPISQGKKGNI